MTATDPDPAPPSGRRRGAAQAFYGPLADADSPARRVGWEDDDAHRLRMAAVALAAGPLGTLTSALDAGCGEAALLPELRRRGFAGRYRGEDILAHMVERAAEANAGDPDASFVAADAFADGPAADVVLCSGALNTLAGAVDHDAEVAAALTALWSRTGERLVVDLAVADRHPPGAGIARADLGRAWSLARSLAPVVAVREDGVPGEALLVLSRSRAAALTERLPDPRDAIVRARLLLSGGEAAAARALAAPLQSPEARLVVALADLQDGQHGRAEAGLRRLAGTPVAGVARLHLASVLWITGRRRASEALLRELAATHDEARVHLVELLVGRGAREEARTIAATIEDAWIQREAERMIEP
ncbi:MAG: hypothetical protein CVU56_19525 [Deltaproteobacteria bacterium HGW-Deltaproteobacteria-14]|nr:MAG: hypothetical protein CVU56_19525 [Deltaproteobacteria bacterium HGW-Deltaproteobacteria-14]